MEPYFEFPLHLPRRGSRRLLRELQQQLRAAILDGRLAPGVRLPPTRALARAYAISRNTALAAYALLLSEGYLIAGGKSGTRVAAVLPRLAPIRRSAERTRAGVNPYWRRQCAPQPQPPARCDFQLGVPDTRSFPFATWRRLAARAGRALSKAPATYGDAQGQSTLREAIAHHVSFTRAVACRAEDVIVTAGAQQAFDLLARVFVTPGHTVVAVENPGYPPARAAFAAAGASIAPVPVDREGLIVARVPPAARVIYVTPSHQFPLGVVLSASRRVQLLALARRQRAVLIEDDYDGEFRFSGRPLDALQTLDRAGGVCYVGTFSKSLFPALRLGYIVAPAWARDALIAAKHAADWHCPLAEQETLAAFISEGHLARHVRKMRRLYAQRRELLLTSLARDFARWFEPLPAIAGLHLAARTTLDADALVERARRVEVGVQALRSFYVGRANEAGVAFGYGAADPAAINDGLARLLAICHRWQR